ncbi:fibroblast growth factor 5 isoform X2 [Monodelphis domestica]|uniref:Fibroblast growth factor 5 n=1 Tax=Monodelphis domestica TaxID=13616 RepID=F6S897_MONDO|nr:fibroblast growth factor 5 isoform X2 [Monodelphis domestica]
MSLSFLLLLLFLGHLICSSWAEEKQLLPKAQLGLSNRNRGGSGSRGRNNTSSLVPSSSSSSSASSPSSLGIKGSDSERSSFQWSPSGRRTGSLYCRVGIGFHLQIHPDGKVNGSHEANMLSQVYR